MKARYKFLSPGLSLSPEKESLLTIMQFALEINSQELLHKRTVPCTVVLYVLVKTLVDQSEVV
jgi:hypothetical protein